MSAYSRGPADDFEVWESLQLFDFPQTTKTSSAQTLETGLPVSAFLIGAKKHRKAVGVLTRGGRQWEVQIRAVGRTWFSGETTTPHRGVIIPVEAVVEYRSGVDSGGDGNALDVSLSQAIAVTARERPAVRVTSTQGSRDGIIRAVGTDYVSVSRRSLEGRDSIFTVPFSQLVAVEFLEPGDIS